MHDNSNYSQVCEILQGKCNGQVTTSTYNSIKYEKETCIVIFFSSKIFTFFFLI